MDQERRLDHFHHSEAGDVYDLYNACNGETSGGLLDVRKLDELTAREREALDVDRLREVWEHTASGCVRCQFIVQTLNAARGTMRRRAAAGPPAGEPRPSDGAAQKGRAKGKALGRGR